MKRLCRYCNRPIPAIRLAAKPDALYCVGCQPAEKPILWASAFAVQSERDDTTRIREEGWAQ